MILWSETQVCDSVRYTLLRSWHFQAHSLGASVSCSENAAFVRQFSCVWMKSANTNCFKLFYAHHRARDT